jgi:hypothetical protein
LASVVEFFIGSDVKKVAVGLPRRGLLAEAHVAAPGGARCQRKLGTLGYEEDFILRLAKRIGEVLARALGLAKKGSYDESLEALEQGVGAELGMPFVMLLRLDNESVVRLLGKDKARALAEALRSRGLVLGLAGRHQEANASASRAAEIERRVAGGSSPA